MIRNESKQGNGLLYRLIVLKIKELFVLYTFSKMQSLDSYICIKYEELHVGLKYGNLDGIYKEGHLIWWYLDVRK